MANKKVESVEPTEEKVVEKAVQKSTFLERKLKAINNMEKPAKAERLAHRLLGKVRN